MLAELNEKVRILVQDERVVRPPPQAFIEEGYCLLELQLIHALFRLPQQFEVREGSRVELGRLPCGGVGASRLLFFFACSGGEALHFNAIIIKIN